jgi:hypothetical protein
MINMIKCIITDCFWILTYRSDVPICTFFANRTIIVIFIVADIILMNEWLDEYWKCIGQVEPDPSDVNPEPQDPEDPGEPEEEKK